MPLPPEIILHVAVATAVQLQPAGALTVKLPEPPVLEKLLLSGETPVTHEDELLELLLEPLLLELPLELEPCENNPEFPGVGEPSAASGERASLQAINPPSPANEAPDSNFRNSRRCPAPFASCSKGDPAPDVLGLRSARCVAHTRIANLFLSHALLPPQKCFPPSPADHEAS